MKSKIEDALAQCDLQSRPSRGAWIEISMRIRESGRKVWSRPSRGAWIEMAYRKVPQGNCRGSRPSRGAWIEIRT